MKPSAQLSTGFLGLHTCLYIIHYTIHYTSALHSLASMCDLPDVLMMELVPSELHGGEREKERKERCVERGEREVKIYVCG